nr:MAG TPA: hypothetical protein [Caudoviricetes sp.]
MDLHERQDDLDDTYRKTYDPDNNRNHRQSFQVPTSSYIKIRQGQSQPPRLGGRLHSTGYRCDFPYLDPPSDCLEGRRGILWP